MASIKEFGLSATAVNEWLPWGGIVRPGVMKQKDGSMFSVISYAPYKTEESEVLAWGFRRGWCLWNEHQHAADIPAQDYLIIAWNPFVTKGRSHVGNALRKDISVKNSIDYFEEEVGRFLEEFGKLTSARLLTYQEIMDVLSFSLSMGDDRQEMPDCPLYMDALLSQNIDFRFGSNDVFVNDRRALIVSLFSPEELEDVYDALTHMTYRHVRRLLLFNEKEAKMDLNKYTARWFPTRSVIRHMATDDLLGAYNGYYTDTFLFYLDVANYTPFRTFFTDHLNRRELPYIVEDFNLKEVFWGSVPGLFLANAHPPVTGLRSLSEFLHAHIEVKKDTHDILQKAEHSLIETHVNVSEYIEGGSI
ncbi:MAG: hypothetical protein ACFN1I_00895 [Selenomonas artemidis]